jgi:hypothetical protein
MISLKKITAGLAGALLMFSTAASAFAADKSSSSASYNNSNPQFGVMLSKIDGMIDENASNWNLKVTPGQKLTGSVSVQNVSNKSAKFNVSFEQAFTNDSVVIGYVSGNNNKSLRSDMSLKKMTTVAKNEITVPANSTTTVPVTITVPTQGFDGSVLGAVVVTKEIPKGAKTSASFVNQFTYVKGVRLTETDNAVTVNLTSTNKGKVSVVDSEQVFRLPISNNTTAVLGNVSIDTKITRLADDKVVMTDKQTARQIAPNSTFTYNLAADSVLSAGKYHYVVKVTNKVTGKVWTFKNDFTISRTDEGRVRAIQSVAFIPVWVWVLLAILLAVIIIMFIILWRRRKQDEENNGSGNSRSSRSRR